MVEIRAKNKTKNERHKDLCDRLHETYVSKNHDYGDSFSESFREFGLLSAVVRISDKFNRLKALSKVGAMVKDESIQDTLLDMANYCLMTYLEIEEEGE